MLRSRGATARRVSTVSGVLLLVAATFTALPVARWGDSALVLLLLPAAVASHLVGRRMSSLAAAVVAFAAVFVVSLPVSFLLPGGAPLGDWMTSVLIALLAVVAPWWWGRYRLLRAEQREMDAEALAERAQAEERARIADDLHDTIGHELALIAVQAGALELGRGLDPEQREQFRELREAAVRASGRLRDVVRVTRPDGPGRLDPSGGAGIEALITGARDAGMTVDADVEPTLIAGAHPLLAELAVRTVREGLTNAARHARGARVWISVAGSDAGGLTVSVRSAASAEPRQQGGGHGIPSLRRRAELLGASIEAEPTADGGFHLQLRTPAMPDTARPTMASGGDTALRSNARLARRRALQAAVVPITIVAVMIVGFGVVQAATVAQTAISSDTYERIELGMTRSQLATVLPAGVPKPVPVVTEPPAPEGAECDYFAARDSWLHFTDATYRLCFDEGVLVEKTLLEAP